MRNNDRHIDLDKWADDIADEVNVIETNTDNAYDLISEVESVLRYAESRGNGMFIRF